MQTKIKGEEMNEVKHETAAEFWEERFGESPRTDAEKLAVAMMTEYADYVYAKFIKTVNQKNRLIKN